MSSKKKIAVSSLHIPFCFLLLTLFSSPLFPEVIDRIVAVVNDHIITLTDLKIADAFGLYEYEFEGDVDDLLSLILERMVNQKIVIDATKENISVGNAELEASLERIIQALGREEFQEKLDEFGLSLEELEGHFKEKIMYQKVISRRFGQEVILSLKEIETYYKEVYIPAQEERGLEPRPMTEILDEIEMAIRQEKMKRQIAEWVNNLRKQADVEIKFDVVKNK